MTGAKKSLRCYHNFLSIALLLTCTMFAACGNGEDENELSEWVEEHGFGPVTEPVELGELDTDLAAQGLSLFMELCSSCHGVEGQIIGPALRPSVDRRTPEYMMNHMINPGENRDNHPIGRELAEHYPARMINLSITKEEARAIYEYLRYYNETRENPPLN